MQDGSLVFSPCFLWLQQPMLFRIIHYCRSWPPQMPTKYGSPLFNRLGLSQEQVPPPSLIILPIYFPALHLSDRTACVQYASVSLAIIGGIAMLIPVLTIDEKKYCRSKPSSTPLLKALKQSLSSTKKFIYFIIAVLAYSMALNIITNGMLYFLTVLCHIDASQGPKFIGYMFLLALLFFPVVNILAKRFGEKKLLVISFFILGLAFAGIALIGKLPITPVVQSLHFSCNCLIPPLQYWVFCRMPCLPALHPTTQFLQVIIWKEPTLPLTIFQ